MSIEIKPFKPRSLQSDSPLDYQNVKKHFGTMAATDPEFKGKFNLHPASKAGLGIEREEQSHLEVLIQEQVNARFEEVKKSAHDEGYADGFKKGETEARTALESEVRPLIDHLNQMLTVFDGMKDELYTANESLLMRLVSLASKQIILRELKLDPDYLKRLVSNLVERVGAKDFIKILISKSDLEQIDALRAYLKESQPDLKNITIEASDDIKLGGCKVETELARVNASLETQLAGIEKSLEGA